MEKKAERKEDSSEDVDPLTDEYSHEFYVVKHIDFDKWYELEWTSVDDNLLKTEILFNGQVYEVTAYLDDYKREEEGELQIVDVKLKDRKYQ